MEIIATNIDKFGKTKKSKDIVPGKCIFPFKYKKKNVNECIDGKTGKWCATSLKKNNSAKTWGYCPEENKMLKKSIQKSKSQVIIK